MGSLKTLAYVGAVAMVVGSAVTTASAADLAPAPLMPPPPPPIMESTGGLYLRGDIGVGHMGESTASSRITTPGYVVPDLRYDRTSFDGVAFGGVGIGYQYNSFVRFDVTGEYRTASRYNARISYRDDFNTGCFGGRCYDLYDASVRSMVFLANGYLDLGTWRGLTPFIGAGVGVANHKVSGLTDVGYPTLGYGFAADKSRTSFAWALMAGVGFEVTRNLKMEVAYRYLNMGTAESGKIGCNFNVCAGETQRYKLQSHDVKVGFRYLLADDLPAPVMMPAPAPVMRRY